MTTKTTKTTFCDCCKSTVSREGGKSLCDGTIEKLFYCAPCVAMLDAERVERAAWDAANNAASDLDGGCF